MIQQGEGIRCPKCNSINQYVRYTGKEDDSIKRKRKCFDCGFIFKTRETIICDRKVGDEK